MGHPIGCVDVQQFSSERKDRKYGRQSQVRSEQAIGLETNPRVAEAVNLRKWHLTRAFLCKR